MFYSFPTADSHHVITEKGKLSSHAWLVVALRKIERNSIGYWGVHVLTETHHWNGHSWQLRIKKVGNITKRVI